jgi:hypothetical protein
MTDYFSSSSSVSDSQFDSGEAWAEAPKNQNENSEELLSFHLVSSVHGQFTGPRGAHPGSTQIGRNMTTNRGSAWATFGTACW